MTAKAAICKALLLGKTLNIQNGFGWFGVTNIPREIGRSVERAFGVKCERKKQEGLTRYDVPCTWTDYRLRITIEQNEGLIKMIKYVMKAEGEAATEKAAEEQMKLATILLYLTT